MSAVTGLIEILGLDEMLELGERISASLRRRFERDLALAYSDIVGSTAYFAAHGDAAGRALQQRHLDLLAEIAPRHGGRVVDTAGDGALVAFASSGDCVTALGALERAIDEQNRRRPRAHALRVRCAAHFGSVLTDGTMVTGEAAGVCARVAAASAPGEIWVTGSLAARLPVEQRSRCRLIARPHLEGLSRPIDVLSYAWGELP
jgi:class 3 adenylate cyclase